MEIPKLKKEKMPKVDYRQIFWDKLNSMPALSDDEIMDESRGFSEFGIQQVRKKAPAIIFEGKKIRNDRNYDLWIEDPNDVSRRFPHDELEDSLKYFQEERGIKVERHGSFHGYVIQDEKNNVHLFFEGIAGQNMFKNVNQFAFIGYKKWMLNLMRKYGVEKMICNLSEFHRDGLKVLEEALEVDTDVVGKTREENYFRDFAEKYGMTYSQYIKFRAYVRSNWEAGKPTDCEKIAQEIIAEKNVK